MKHIDQLPKSQQKALVYNNCSANNLETKSTKLATECIVKILDDKYEKANLPDIVKNNCDHLWPEEQEKLLELLIEFEDLFLVGTLGD